LDDLDECFDKFREDQSSTFVDRSAVELDILKHTNCSSFSDLNPQFCEGVEGIGANTPDTYADGANARLIGHTGKGGCYIDSYGETLGRDWFWNGDADGIYKIGYEEIDREPPFSTSFHGETDTIWRCCGNDPEDFGALMSYSGLNFRNRFICANNGSAGALWLNAREIGKPFTIFKVERPFGDGNVTFDVVSNSDNWFVCNGTAGLDSLYDKAVLDPVTNEWTSSSGPLLREYNILPPNVEDIQYGVTVGPEGGPDGWDDIGGDNGGIPGSGNNARDVVTEDEFESGIGDVSGPSQVTDCDKDGDGYDGFWSEDPSADHWDGSGTDWTEHTGPRYDDYLTCEPRQPYDCHDNDRTISPGMIDYCDSTDPAENSVDNDCNVDAPCIPNMGGESPDELSGQVDFASLITRFMCHDIDGYGAFAECCGWDLGNCHNRWKGRREGSAIHTLYEFTDYAPAQPAEDVRNNNNVVLRYGTNVPPSDMSRVADDDTYRLNLPYHGFDESFRNLSRYKNLEFDIYLTTNFEVELWVGFLNPAISETSDEARVPENFIFPFKGKVVDYVIAEPSLRKWMHVVVPVSEIYSAGEFRVGNIVFASNVKKIKSLGTSVQGTIGGSTGTFSNIIGLDKIMLRPEESNILKPGDENYYCSGTWPPVWVSDLDDSTETGLANEQAGKSACNSIPSYQWTGNYCCGDDGKSSIDATQNEFFNDSKGACWNSRYLANNERVMLVQYQLSYTGFDELITRSCTNFSCTYDLPARAGVIVENPNPDVYDLAFIDGGYTPIGDRGISPTDDSMLRAEEVPLQVQYLDGDFYTCNADPDSFIFNIDNSLTGDALLSADSEHGFASCQVKGKYFCDHKEGRNRGWDSETVAAYPSVIAEDGSVKSNLTMADGTSELFSGTVLPATKRIDEKPMYNLVRNGGFENV